MNKKIKISVYSEDEIDAIVKEIDLESLDEEDYEVAENFREILDHEQIGKRKIIDLIEKNPGITLDVLSELSNVTVKTLSWMIEELENDRLIKREIRLSL